MSIKLNRAMGYGMPWARFQELFLTINEADDVYQTVNRRLDKAAPEDFMIPKSYQKTTFPGLLAGPREFMTGPVHILERNLLARSVWMDGRFDAKMGTWHDLVCLVMDPDNTHEIIFFPNAMTKRRWHHEADPLDYAFEDWGRGETTPTEEAAPRTLTRYLNTGHELFRYLLMHPDGRRAEVDWWSVRGTENMLPGVPEEIRWLVSKFNLLPEPAITEIRPLIAQWWC
jgi:hypothetical protein